MFLQHNTRTLLFIPIGLYYLLIMQEWLIYINILLRIKTIRLKALIMNLYFWAATLYMDLQADIS